MKITIGRFEFRSKKAAREHIRKILWSTPRGLRLMGDDAELVMALAYMHPAAEEKIGVGIDYVSVGTFDYGAPGFQITRVDGTRVPFSYDAPLDGAPSHRGQVNIAMRWAIDPQIRSFRRKMFEDSPAYTCPETGIVITNTPDTEVDHVNPTFAKLADAYAASVGGFDDIGLCRSDDHSGPALVEPHRAQFWQFHGERARLQLVHRLGNIARSQRAS
jgi:hypothetical protein